MYIFNIPYAYDYFPFDKHLKHISFRFWYSADYKYYADLRFPKLDRYLQTSECNRKKNLSRNRESLPLEAEHLDRCYCICRWQRHRPQPYYPDNFRS